MDKLDIRILRELAQGAPFLPSREGLELSKRGIARKLGVAEGTVRYRVGKMLSSGVLKGSTVFPNPSLVGISFAAYGFDVSSSIDKKDVVQKLRGIDDMLIIQNHHGSFIGSIFAYADDWDLKSKLLLLDSWKGTRDGIFSHIRFPPCSMQLQSRDWQLISLLAKGNYSSHALLAKGLTVSERTVKRMLYKLIDSSAIFSLPVLDFRAIRPGAPADLLVLYSDRKSRIQAEGRILQAVEEYISYVGIWEEQGLYSLILPNPAKATEVVEEARALPGVTLARIELVDEHFDYLRRLMKYADKRISL